MKWDLVKREKGLVIEEEEETIAIYSFVDGLSWGLKTREKESVKNETFLLRVIHLSDQS